MRHFFRYFQLIQFLIVNNILSILLIFVIVAYCIICPYQPSIAYTTDIAGPVKIVRDNYGVPYITATKSDLDAFYALGYVHAQDRLWQMDFQRRLGEGKLSELFGKKTIDIDKYTRTWGFYRLAKQTWKNLDKKTQRILQHYTQGVNFFIKQKHLPLQFHILNYTPQKWTVYDVLVFQKVMAWNLQNNWRKKLANAYISQHFSKTKIEILQPPYPEDGPKVLSRAFYNGTKNDLKCPTSSDKFLKKKWIQFKQEKIVNSYFPFHEFNGKGSNGWVISGKLTNTGKPLLANDPHLNLNAPNLWYLAGLYGPGINVIGATIPGIPAVIIGHNKAIAWGMTNANVNTEDIYIEPNNSKFLKINEKIKVKDGNSVDITILISKHGPILNKVIPELSNLGKYVSLKWVAFEPNDTTIQAFLDINYSHNWHQFKKGLSYFVSPTQNFIYADKKGNIGYYLAGRIPIRKYWSGAFPIRANQLLEWNGYINFKLLPHVYNPSNGMIVSANNKIIDNYSYNINFRWETPPFRAHRINDLLKSKKRISMDDVKSIQNDCMDYYWIMIKPYLLKVKPINNDSKYALFLLKNWDGKMSKQSIPATIFSYWISELNTDYPKELYKITQRYEPLFILNQLKSDGKSFQQNNHSSYQEFLTRSLQEAMVKLIADRGKDKNEWRWGKVHELKLVELGIGHSKLIGWLWNRKIGTSGSFSTVNAAPSNKKHKQTAGASYRQIIDLNDLENSIYIQTLGQVDSPLSWHHNDLLKLWSSGKYIPMSLQNKQSILLLLSLSKKPILINIHTIHVDKKNNHN